METKEYTQKEIDEAIKNKVISLLKEATNQEPIDNDKFTTLDNFPSWAAYYAAYGDASGLGDEEINMVNKFMRDNKYHHLVEVSDETNFSQNPAFGLACDVFERAVMAKV